MTAQLEQIHPALWLDPKSAVGTDEREQLEAAGLRLLPVATLDDLRGRIRKTIDYVASFQPAQIDGSESREIQLVKRNGDVLRFQGEEYLKHNAMPNFYFHVTTLYALLRQAGVAVGKGDYLGA